MHLLAGAALAGLACAIACGAADSVSGGTARCIPTLCLASDKIEAPPDGEKACPTGVCNYQSQTGCPAAATCGAQPDSMTATITPKCVQTGTRDRGQVCDATNLCLPGYQCIHAAGKPGFCRKLCCGDSSKGYGDWTACPTGESCIRSIVATFEQPPNSGNKITVDAHVYACVPVNNCDVLDKDSCHDDPDADDPSRPVCRIADPTGNVACLPPGSATLGEPCAHLDQCGPVQICAQSTDKQGIPHGDFTCRRLCRLPQSCGDRPCPSEEGTCVHFNRDPAGVGECTPNWNPDDCIQLDGGPFPTMTRPEAGVRDATSKG